MQDNPRNRVLSRMGARELTHEEAAEVIGAQCPKRCTLTLCTLDPNGTATDGDTSLGEC